MKPAAAPRLLVALAFLAFVSLGLPDTLLGVAWPSIQTTFGLPISALGVLSACGTAGYFGSSFVAGSLMNRVGVGWILIGSGAIVALSLAGYATSPVWLGLCISAFLAGIGAGAIDAGVNAFAAHAFSPRLLNWMHACWGVGATIGPIVMTAAIAGRAGWRIGYAVVAGAIVGLTVVFIATRRLWETDRAVRADAPAAPHAGLAESIRHLPVRLHAGFFFIYGCVEMGAGNWLFSMLTEARGLPIATAGSLVGAYWASLTVGRIAFGQLAQHVAAVTVLRIGLAGGALGAALLLPGLPGAAALIAPVLLGFSIAPLFPTMISQTPRRVGERFAAQSVALQVSACGLGIATGSALIGVLARRVGLDVLPAVLLVAVGLLSLVHEWIERLPRAAEARATGVAFAVDSAG